MPSNSQTAEGTNREESQESRGRCKIALITTNCNSMLGRRRRTWGIARGYETGELITAISAV